MGGLRPRKPVGDTNGTVLRFTLHHRFEAPLQIGRFRLWITTADQEAATEGLPAGLAPILRNTASRRAPAQTDQLRASAVSQDPAALARDFELTLARLPIPDDARLAELEQDLARAARSAPIDPTLVRLRQDLELSARQLTHKRVTAVQDLTWALINTPAFLFNH